MSAKLELAAKYEAAQAVFDLVIALGDLNVRGQVGDASLRLSRLCDPPAPPPHPSKWRSKVHRGAEDSGLSRRANKQVKKKKKPHSTCCGTEPLPGGANEQRQVDYFARLGAYLKKKMFERRLYDGMPHGSLHYPATAAAASAITAAAADDDRRIVIHDTTGNHMVAALSSEYRGLPLDELGGLSRPRAAPIPPNVEDALPPSKIFRPWETPEDLDRESESESERKQHDDSDEFIDVVN